MSRRVLIAYCTVVASMVVAGDSYADDAECMEWVPTHAGFRCAAWDRSGSDPPPDSDPLPEPDEEPGDGDPGSGDRETSPDGYGGGGGGNGLPGADDRTEAPGGGSGESPPRCVERPVRGLGLGSGYTVDDTGRAFGVFYRRQCDDGTDTIVVREAEPPPPGQPVPDAPPPPDPRDLAEELYGEMIVELPSPTIHVAPADLRDDRLVFVQTPTYLWIDEWAAMSSTLTVGSVWVSLRIEPVRVEVDLGNGDTISCVDPPAFPPGADPTTFAGCGYTYRHSSAMAPNGESYPVTVTLVWSAVWTSNVGAGGNLGEITTSSDRDLRVAEIQAVLTEG